MIGQLLCSLGLHKRIMYPDTVKEISYERWGRTYQMSGLFYCDRDCGVDDQERFWTE